MACTPFKITVGTTATLIFECIDGLTYDGLTSPAANILKCGTGTDPVPLLIILPTTGTVYFGGSTVTSSTGVGFAASTLASFMINNIGGDSLYAAVASGTAIVQMMAFRQ
jgi:hypothetical protein